MLIRYLGIFLLGFLLFSCGAPPAGWESADFSSGGDGDGDDQPPADTQLFLADAAVISQSLTDHYSMNYTITISSQPGWCHDPNDGTVSGNTIEMILQVGGATYYYTYTFDGGTVSDGSLTSSAIYEYEISGTSGSGEYDYELRFNSDFSSATYYVVDDSVITDTYWGDIPSTGSCE